jgi:hypothetical protein
MKSWGNRSRRPRFSKKKWSRWNHNLEIKMLLYLSLIMKLKRASQREKSLERKWRIKLKKRRLSMRKN